MRASVVLAVATMAVCAAAQSLPQFNASLSEVTVSGLSSGAFFAVQMQVAFSKTIKGVGVFAGGQYDCAGGSEITALTKCMSAEPTPPSPSTAILTTDLRADAGSIDPVSNLADAQVYLYSGTLDSTVNPKVMSALNQYYLNYAKGAGQVVFVNNVTSAHTQPTDDPVNTNPCWLSTTPYISDCSYDGAGAALNHIFGAPLPNPRNTGTLGGKIVSFSQGTYMPSGVSTGSQSLANTGYAFIPAQCSAGEECKIHIAYHGCEQSTSHVGMDWVEHTGFNKWADTNNIVVIYPQTQDSYLSPSNPNGCWDWWGFAGSNYDVQSGGQMQFSMNIFKATTNKP